MIPYLGADPHFSLEGKTAVITGGAAGIGNATARFFAEKGVTLVLADLNPEVDALAKKLGPQHIGVPGNVCDPAYRAAVLEKGIKAFGKVDILVNSAGIARLDKAESISEAFWDQTMEINLKASFMMAQVFGAYLIEKNFPAAS